MGIGFFYFILDFCVDGLYFGLFYFCQDSLDGVVAVVDEELEVAVEDVLHYALYFPVAVF